MPVEKAMLAHLGREVHFGWRAATEDMKRRAVSLGAYLKKYGAKPPPASVDYGAKATAALAEMLGNDQAGDCVIAAELHGAGVWSANEPGGKPRVPTTAEALSQYRRICGPGDNGCYIPSVLDYQRDTGMTAGGVSAKIDGYVKVNPRDQLLMKYALWLFGRVNFGVNWPGEWMNLRPGFVLQPPRSRNIVGGHSILGYGYDSVGVKVSTWGITGTLSWEALADPSYVDECYAMLGPDWYSDDGMTAAGVKVDKLRAALQTVATGGYPDLGDDPEPPPPPIGDDWLWQKLWEPHVLGYVLHAHLGLRKETAYGMVAGLDWWALASAVWRCYTAFRAQDWAALATAALDVLRLIGIDLPAERAREIGSGIGKALEGLPGGQKAGSVNAPAAGDSAAGIS